MCSAALQTETYFVSHMLLQAENERNTLGLVTIERDEYNTLKTRKEAAAKGRSLLSQLVSH